MIIITLPRHHHHHRHHCYQHCHHYPRIINGRGRLSLLFLTHRRCDLSISARLILSLQLVVGGDLGWNMVVTWWQLGGNLVPPWWQVGGNLVANWWHLVGKTRSSVVADNRTFWTKRPDLSERQRWPHLFTPRPPDDNKEHIIGWKRDQSRLIWKSQEVPATFLFVQSKQERGSCVEQAYEPGEKG